MWEQVRTSALFARAASEGYIGTSYLRISDRVSKGVRRWAATRRPFPHRRDARQRRVPYNGAYQLNTVVSFLAASSKGLAQSSSLSGISFVPVRHRVWFGARAIRHAARAARDDSNKHGAASIQRFYACDHMREPFLAAAYPGRQHHETTRVA